ncbi:radical SAM family heme chaperone HemW [Aldersonia sp. NBC_00410]|uniref:radical SAM family heme chaperone HemW n=1 Tax=Aldersonia sp. NBC_00410 TaxID=2975954 RepID=UPI00224E9D15|nr:radical SAM family heme chaperone HemW [Aldersonia sp. NBC_00410]MCX5042727.1 radical SAM family heme chaperone HemW [Aldersonia sp. NBC_00410]
MNSLPTVAPSASFELSDVALDGVGRRPFGIYVHVPFCATRCGYCDFNTYTAGELGSSASPQSWLEGLRTELDLAADVLARSPGGVPRTQTVFVGGGTPSLLGGDGLAAVLDAVRASFGLADDAEVTTESNPESTGPEFFEHIRAAGYTRISLGMQSAAPHVLAMLDRVHTPGRPVAAAREARAAGFDHVNLDLIYGTPGERAIDLARSLDAVLEAGVDHVSAYALIVEDGTALSRRIRRGEVAAPDDDVLAARYEQVDARLTAAGLHWYEVSNWAADAGDSGWASGAADSRCRHNLGYWDGGDWWGAGPGAHSHVGGVRWWNVKHPARYAQTLSAGVLPVQDSETLTSDETHTEEVMLTTRLRTGLPAGVLDPSERTAADALVADGLLVHERERFVLTDRGRLLADAVVRTVLS